LAETGRRKNLGGGEKKTRSNSSKKKKRVWENPPKKSGAPRFGTNRRQEGKKNGSKTNHSLGGAKNPIEKSMVAEAQPVKNTRGWGRENTQGKGRKVDSRPTKSKCQSISVFPEGR